MKRIILAALASGLLFCPIHNARVMAEIVDFDDVVGTLMFQFDPARIVAGDRYQSLGVLLSTDGVRLYASGPHANANTPPNYIWGGNASATHDVIADFVIPGTSTSRGVNEVSFYLYDSDTGVGSPWTASIYDEFGGLLDSVTDTTNDNVLVAFSRSTNDIFRMVFSPSTDKEGIDTLSFSSTVATPEPSTYALLCFGAATLLACGWRRIRIPGALTCPRG